MAGRPNKYETHVKPYLDDIKRWSLDKTEKQIAKLLGVGYSSWCDYKNKYSELSEAIKKGRGDLVDDLKSVLIEKAKGFDYKEEKIIMERSDITGELITTRKEVYKKRALPDVAALNLLLKNYDSENWANDPQALALRKEEIEIQKKKLEDSSW